MNPLQGGGIALLPPARGHGAHTHAHAAAETAATSHSPQPGQLPSARTHRAPHKHAVMAGWRLPLTQHHCREQRRDTVLLHGSISHYTLGCFWSYRAVTKAGFAHSAKGEQSSNHNISTTSIYPLGLVENKNSQHCTS